MYQSSDGGTGCHKVGFKRGQSQILQDFINYVKDFAL